MKYIEKDENGNEYVTSPAFVPGWELPFVVIIGFSSPIWIGISLYLCGL